jgi:hypothetical protein
MFYYLQDCIYNFFGRELGRVNLNRIGCRYERGQLPLAITPVPLRDIA